MQTNKARICVIVPVYNVENYLRKCLDSLLEQSYQDFLIICVNDGSQDSSGSILSEYQLKYPDKLVHLVKANGGLSDARNFGIHHSNSELICFVDSDDYVDNKYLEMMVQDMDQNHSDVSICDMMYVYPSHQEFSSGGDFKLINGKQPKAIMKLNNSACNKLFKRSLFNDSLFPVGLWYEDMATIPGVLIKANIISKVNVPLYYYLQRENSIAHTINPRIFDIYIALQKMSESSPEYSKPENRKILTELYMRHGLHLTTLRIVQSDSPKEVIQYLSENRKRISIFCPSWLYQIYSPHFTIKENILFWLYRFKLFGTIRSLLN